ncbi:hypothetical protein BS329_39465 [Amycolatopsis coloradensis]|uniref:Peptidase inhibitor family I36 n=1 Tax=Amycolatopsis coloradensis TaxID=76021 RepID=A0A1R0KEB6_9PSEU|nr:peptidase inhibitor family I36 protein [Amycolatopsis coloradensis]OLZ43403.1 hypothetical protein BS329_39465 [Amycolatopsis coloradensis]
MKKLSMTAPAFAAVATAATAFAPTASAAPRPELCVHTASNYGGSTTCSNGWSGISIGNYRIRSWSNTTDKVWCLESDRGTWRAYPGYEPYADYGEARFHAAREC